MQLQMFRRKIVDELGVLGGVTSARSVRADDNLNYVVKDDAPPDAPTVRASEYIWLSVARAVGLAAPQPEIIEDGGGRALVATRREQNAVGRDYASSLTELLAGTIHNGSSHLSRLYAFDLFCANWDRHPGNYLVLDDGGVKVIFAIDFSHVTVHPGLASAARDPISVAATATRAFFPQVTQPYGADSAAAIEMVERLEKLPDATVDAILTATPDDWISDPERDGVRSWWKNGSRAARS